MDYVDSSFVDEHSVTIPFYPSYWEGLMVNDEAMMKTYMTEIIFQEKQKKNLKYELCIIIHSAQ